MRWVTTGLLVVALGACASESLPPDDRGSLIVTGDDGSVTMVDPEDGQVTELAAPSLHPGPVQPTSSRDGSVVVWSAIDEEGRPMVMVREDGDIREIASPTLPFFYAFSPGDDLVAALGNDPEGANVALVVVDLTQDTAEIVEVGQPYYLAWEPGAERMAVHRGEDELALVSPDGEREALALELGRFQAPDWTEAGEIVAPVRVEEITASAVNLQAAVERLSRVDPEVGDAEPVVDLAEMALFEVAGDRVAYLEGDRGLGALTVVDLDGRDPVEVHPDDVAAFEWSPDGQRLLFHVLDGDGLTPHVWSGGEVTPFGGFVPTGRILAEYLPFWSQYTRTITQWAPDGSAFAYAAAGDGGDGTIWIQPLEGERREVGTGSMVTWAP